MTLAPACDDKPVSARSTRLRVEGLKPCHTLATRAPKSSNVIILKLFPGPPRLADAGYYNTRKT